MSAIHKHADSNTVIPWRLQRFESSSCHLSLWVVRSIFWEHHDHRKIGMHAIEEGTNNQPYSCENKQTRNDSQHQQKRHINHQQQHHHWTTLLSKPTPKNIQRRNNNTVTDPAYTSHHHQQQGIKRKCNTNCHIIVVNDKIKTNCSSDNNRKKESWTT